MNWFQRRRQAFREIRNWFFIRKQIKRERKSEPWTKYNLDYGWINQIYAVVNLRKEDMGEEEMVQRMKILQKIEPINRYLDSLDLSEIIYPEIVRIKDSRSWLVIYWPIFDYFSVWRTIFWIVGLSVSIYFINKYSLITEIINLFY